MLSASVNTAKNVHLIRSTRDGARQLICMEPSPPEPIRGPAMMPSSDPGEYFVAVVLDVPAELHVVRPKRVSRKSSTTRSLSRTRSRPHAC